MERVIDNDKLEALRNSLRHGDYHRIAAMTGKSYGYVRQVLTGKRNNPDIIDSAAAVAADNAKQLERIHNNIQEGQAQPQA